MTVDEFRYEFDLAWDNIMSNQAPSLSDYEKSVFLTNAQEAYVKAIYDSFENTEKVRSFLSTIVKQTSMVADNISADHIVKESKFFKLPFNDDDLFFIVYEGARTTKNCDSDLLVKPVTHDAFWETYKNPFRGANGNRILRIMHHEKNNVFELVSKDPIKEYHIRYVKRPVPIIIPDSNAAGLFINGLDATVASECELPAITHRDILQLAVQNAQQSWFQMKK